jgi:hypothetical protein
MKYFFIVNHFIKNAYRKKQKQSFCFKDKKAAFRLLFYRSHFAFILMTKKQASFLQ